MLHPPKNIENLIPIFVRYKNDKEFFQYLPHESPPGNWLILSKLEDLNSTLVVQHFLMRGVTLRNPIYEIFNNTIRLWLRRVNLDSQGVYG